MQHINFWTIHPSITFIDRLFIISWVWLAIRKTPIISCGNVSNMRWDDVLLLPFQPMHQLFEKVNFLDSSRVGLNLHKSKQGLLELLCKETKVQKPARPTIRPKSLYRSCAGRHFYGTANEIWVGFGLVSNPEK